RLMQPYKNRQALAGPDGMLGSSTRNHSHSMLAGGLVEMS
ncbi:MAG: hypothetical protein JWO82_1490, partial [Akkermansiaceae bacterium]|nr:hypothetical protein [Akkermansiaceae bacterium]